MKQVIILEAVCFERLQTQINKELLNFSSDDTDLQFATCLDGDGQVCYNCMVIVKDCKKSIKRKNI